jgi:hypothetical protein
MVVEKLDTFYGRIPAKRALYVLPMVLAESAADLHDHLRKRFRGDLRARCRRHLNIGPNRDRQPTSEL